MTSLRRAALALLLLVAAWQLGGALVIELKAHLAQQLIARAWSQSLASGGTPVKPWPWADTWPVARLQVPRHGQDLYVLSGADGQSLAFGPGHLRGSAAPGEAGISVIGGHRDTHFAFLRDLQANTRIYLQLPDGDTRHYRVEGGHVVNAARERLVLGAEAPSQLLLVTCYPFAALRPGGPLRYVVSARPSGRG